MKKRSFEIITEELLSRGKADAILPENELVVKRVIHTTADFDYVDNLCISEGAVQKGMQALKNGACIVTDTRWRARASIKEAGAVRRRGVLLYLRRGRGCTGKAAGYHPRHRQHGKRQPSSTVRSSLPSAMRPPRWSSLNELMEQGLRPELIIGVPVGFVNVVEAKELILRAPVPYIVARGRKGGSNVAAAICNAMLYQL